MAADLSGRRPRHHPAVNEVLSTLASASSALTDVQRRLDLEFRASYPDHVSKPILCISLSSLEDSSEFRRARLMRFAISARRVLRFQVNPVKLVARVKRIQEEVAALKGLCRDLLAQKQVTRFPPNSYRSPKARLRIVSATDPVLLRAQELIDKMRTSLGAQRGMAQRLLASSGLPLISDADEAAYANLNQVTSSHLPLPPTICVLARPFSHIIETSQ
ncbi:hypothetical protein ABZP36_016327 [Zizania latifolia]